MTDFNVFFIVGLILVVIVASKIFRIVPQGMEYTVERFGRYVSTLRPGMNVVVPFIYTIGHKINMMERVMDVPSQEVITKDNAMVTVDGVVFFQVVDAAQASYEVNNLEYALSSPQL